MSRFPYTNFPFPFYRNYSRIPPPISNFPRSSINNNYFSPPNTINNASTEKEHKDYSKNPYSSTDFSEIQDSRNINKKNKSNKNNEDYLFDLFGLKIYSDDVLLVSLIYFLYSEGVKDDGLFIVLVLLLIS